jgi:alanyl-tRNA synthetase
VGPERLRLDIAYDRPLTATQKSQLEDFCQQHVDAHCSVNTQIMSQEDALATGAMAIFGDKYGATVRVLSIGDNVSKELCGGTHIANLVELSTLIILSDEPLSSGVRRIQALSGPAAIRWLRDRSEIVSTLSAQFQSASSQIIRVVSDLQIQHNNLMKSVDKLRQSRLLEILKTQGIQKINTHPVVFMQIDSEDKSHMNILADHLNMVKGFDHAIGLTALVWIKEEDKYTLLLIQEGNANLDLQGLSTVLKEKLAFKGGGRPKKIQLGGVFHGNIQNTLIDGINQLSTV